ncbi:hypothetical protein P692DRAFT_20874749 [Suillus brevipes Sb2]|nr:hypothetical protein P692DRAFT_20874749 [Suillus brevipes Sb2]
MSGIPDVVIKDLLSAISYVSTRLLQGNLQSFVAWILDDYIPEVLDLSSLNASSKDLTQPMGALMAAHRHS